MDACTDSPNWTNGHGATCANYAAWCTGGAFKADASWASGEGFNWPERHCCVCGGTANRAMAPPPPPPFDGFTAHRYELHLGSYCRGADREVKKPSLELCEAHCASRKCACAHFARGLCRFGFTYLGLLRSDEGFSAFVRPNAASEPAAIKAAQRLAGGPPTATCGKPPSRVVPSFYMYDGPAFAWAERLAACYEKRTGRPPWAMPAAPQRNGSRYTGSGNAPHADLSHSLWLHTALATHRKRRREGEGAALYVVPAFGSLSEATGTCEGTTHLERMAAAAAAVRASPWFTAAPKRHVVFAGATSEDRTPLGELGAMLAKGGAIGLCTSRAYCSARFAKRAEVPMLPLLSLMQPKLAPRLTAEACPLGGGSGARRKTTLFFRGAHGTTEQAQATRARLWELRDLPGADIKFSKGGPGILAAETRARLREAGWTGKDVRMPFNTVAQAAGMLRSDFCALPRGEGTSTGRRLLDAIAAGCVPVWIGDTMRPPLGSWLKYANFTVRVAETEFLHFPKETIRDALAAAAPRLPELRRQLVRARDDLLLGLGTHPFADDRMALHGADLVLLQAGKVYCPRTPSTLRTCVDTLA